MNRSRDYYREMREKHIKRKKRIEGYSYSYTYWDSSWYSCDGKYSKGKIHCSCGMCRAKTNNKSWRKRTIHGNYAPNHNWKASDVRKIQKMDYDETKEKEYDRFSEGYDEELVDGAAVVDGVTLDGIPLDGHSLLDDLFEGWD